MENVVAVRGLKYQCARLEGDIKSLQAENRCIDLKIEKLRQRQRDNDTKISVIESQIKTVEQAGLLAFNVDLTETDARQTWPKRHLEGWGAISRQVLTQLRLAKGYPLTTRDIADDLNRLFGLNYVEPEIFSLRTSVRSAIKSLNRYGLVRRVSKQSGHERFSTWVIADFAE